MSFQVHLDRNTIESIEARRDHDVRVVLNMVLRYFEDGSNHPQAAYAQAPFDISESKWLKILTALGHRSSWVLYVDRPEIEGWDKAIELLHEAEERISSKDPEGTIVKCRAAWNAIEPLLNGRIEDIKPEVDRGSTPEEGQRSKSSRVMALKDAALQFSHTGPHPENYHASMDDALLAYRVTASIITYLSHKVWEADRHALTATKK